MKITEEWLKDKNILCSECLGKEFIILENNKLKCKNCGLESDVLDASLSDMMNINKFMERMKNETQI
ncbi:MAG: hypothetical protein U9N59_11400 [Campylobacterota bacterium]|nr:hypothetical protein [Campylobacterota bacterium]